MALHRRLLLGVLTVGSLLCVYILCLNLERNFSWSMAPLKHFHGFRQTTSRDSLEPPDRPNLEDLWTQPAPTPHPDRPALNPALKTYTAAATAVKLQAQAQNDAPDLSKSNGTRGPTVRPAKPPGPTEPAFVGDTYMNDYINPETGCTDTIRSRVKETTFGERFLEHIPVLQWAKHVTPEQHQRLSRYPGTHGWAVIDYQTLQDTLPVLNSSANWQLLDDWRNRSSKPECSRCAVVGNGGILKNSKKGKEIDSHHYVFRTNGAITKGFEEDVGSRTTHYTFSTNTLMNSMRSYGRAGYRGPPVSQETRYVFLPDHDRDYLMMKAAATHTMTAKGPERTRKPTDLFGKDVSAAKLKMYHPDFIRYLRNRFLRPRSLQRIYNVYRPSTGSVMLLAAMHTCDQVSAYGFMTPDYKNYSDHYFDSTYRKVGFYLNHDLRLEMNLWQQLHQAGLIRLYMRP
uniref:alpha-N-acetylgalactosaminide alpha-2,6-sialyltransferase n=1 Tax=Amphiprion percula TaxID=161767 RepID=A0A3P8T183_AMPPE